MKNRTCSMFKTRHGIFAALWLAVGCGAYDDGAVDPELGAAEEESDGSGDVDIETLRAENEARIAEMVALAQQAPEAAIREVLEQEALHGPVDTEALFQETVNTPLSPSEQRMLDAHFTANGVSLESIEYAGRLITQGGDAIMYADDLLPALQGSAVEKGRTLAQSLTSGTPPVAPNVYSRQVNADYQFWRPFTGLHFVVVRGTTSQAIFDLVLQAATAVVSVGSTSLGQNGNTYSVIKEADYNNLCGQCRAFNYKIDVVYAPVATACPGGTAAVLGCNVFPRITSQNTGAGFVSRMSIGPRMGIVSTNVTGNTAHNRGAIMHELLHGLGLAHLQNESFGGGVNVLKLVVPGTASGTNVLSIMHNSSGNPNWRNTIQPEDIDTLRTLFPPGIGYINGFSTIVAN